jgi:hypothetical protein
MEAFHPPKAPMYKRRLLALPLCALVLAATACSGPATSQPSSAASPATSSASPAGSPWALVPANGASNIRAAGLEVLNAEGAAEHYHAHLDVFDDGKSIPVPAEIGFSFSSDGAPNGISALHVHDGTGIVHIEAPVAGRTYTLGQVLTEWGVLDGTDPTAGSAHSSTKDWTAYVDGTKHDGDIRNVVLKAHEEIALVHGTPPSPVPATFAFPEGL